MTLEHRQAQQENVVVLPITRFAFFVCQTKGKLSQRLLELVEIFVQVG